MGIAINKGFKQFLVKCALFVVLFIGFSFIIGTKLYSNDLLSGWKIEIYGRIGYILLFSLAGFILLYRERLLKLDYFKHKSRDYFLFILSIILLIGFYIFEANAGSFEITLFSILLAHSLLILTMLALVFGIYGTGFIINSIKNFKKEIFYFLIFGIVMALLMNWVWSLWPFFSFLVLKIDAFLLNLIGADYQIIQPDIIRVKSFVARIGEACSGVYSIFLFTALYLFIAFLDWKKINKKKAILLFLPAVIGAFFVNVFRVFSLFIIGGYFSEELAMGMYHSYTGMIFFLIYFAIFWVLFYKWMKNEKNNFISRIFPEDSLYRNSLYLMLSTFIMAVLGFVFWMINARLFTTEEVGLATTLISVMGLITSFSALGLGTSLIRYLPKSERKNDKINTCFTLVAIVTIIITSIFLLAVNDFSPKLLFIKENLFLSFIFIIFMIFASFNSLVDSVFIAYRSTKYILLKNSVFGILKLVFPFLLVSLGAYGIFSSWMISLIIGSIAVVFILIAKFDYKPRFVFYDSIIRKIGEYSFGNYTAGFIGGLPAFLLPLIILHKLSAETSAYYYIAMMIATLLFTIASSTSNSLFSEGSNNEKMIKVHAKKAGKIIALLMIPGIIITVFLGKYVLLLFGREYSIEGFRFLQLLALSGVFVAINSVFGSLFRVRHKIKELIVISLINSFVVLGLSYMLIDSFGLIGVGIAWITGCFVTTGAYFVFWTARR